MSRSSDTDYIDHLQAYQHRKMGVVLYNEFYKFASKIK